VLLLSVGLRFCAPGLSMPRAWALGGSRSARSAPVAAQGCGAQGMPHIGMNAVVWGMHGFEHQAAVCCLTAGQRRRLGRDGAAHLLRCLSKHDERVQVQMFVVTHLLHCHTVVVSRTPSPLLASPVRSHVTACLVQHKIACRLSPASVAPLACAPEAVNLSCGS
jgi:hypothetical protein